MAQRLHPRVQQWIAYLECLGIAVVFENFTDRDGYALVDPAVAKQEIGLKPSLDEPTMLKVLFHELGHIYLHFAPRGFALEAHYTDQEACGRHR